jgi:hypothetical protein
MVPFFQKRYSVKNTLSGESLIKVFCKFMFRGDCVLWLVAVKVSGIFLRECTAYVGTVPLPERKAG